MRSQPGHWRTHYTKLDYTTDLMYTQIHKHTF